ncbi:MAG: hypothetical protein NVS9B10_12170 [Nevskia sp.]
MIRQLLLGLVILLLIVVTAAFASPLLGLQSLRDALAARDETRLLEVVDLDRLRGNVASRVRARYAQAEIKLPVEPVVERLLTPQGLIAAICDGGVLTPGSGPQPRACEVHGSLGDVRFESGDRYSAALTQSGRIAATIVMDRVGLRWRLVDLVLPAGAYDQLKNSVLN